MTGPGRDVPEDTGSEPLVPITSPTVADDPDGSVAVEPLPDPRDAARAATAQRNKEALAQLGRTATGAARSAADATSSAAKQAADATASAAKQAADATGSAARQAAERAQETADAVRGQVAETVARTGSGPTPVGEGVVVAAPGLPTGTGTVQVDPLAGSTQETSRPSPDASSVVVTPTTGTGGAAAEVAGAARQAGDRAAAAGQVAAVKGRQAVEQGQQAASTVRQQAAVKAEQAGAAAQQAGAAAQQAASAAKQQAAVKAEQAGAVAQQAAAAAQQAASGAVASTRSAVASAVDSGRSALRERTAAPIDVEGLAAEVLELPGVARLAPDAAGRGRGLLPGQVAGASVTDDEVRVRVVARYGVPLRELSMQVHDVAARYAEGRETVVEVADLDLTDQEGTP